MSFFVKRLQSKLEKIEYYSQSGIFDILESEDNSIKLPDEELIIEELFIGFKRLALAVANNDIKLAKEFYENWDIVDLFEWFTIKLAMNYRQTEV